MRRTITALLLGLAGGAAQAEPALCAIDARTAAHQCILASELREVDGIRRAPLIAGGPNGIERTAFSVHANCITRVLHVKDRQGVSFGGGSFSDTDMARQLGGHLCSTALPAPKKARR